MCHMFNARAVVEVIASVTCIVGWRILRKSESGEFYGRYGNRPVPAVQIGDGYLFGEPNPLNSHSLTVTVRNKYQSLDYATTVPAGLYAYHDLPPIDAHKDTLQWKAAAPITWVRFVSETQFSALALFAAPTWPDVYDAVEKHQLDPQKYWQFHWKIFTQRQGTLLPTQAQANLLDQIGLGGGLRVVAHDAPCEIEGIGPYKARLTCNFFEVE